MSCCLSSFLGNAYRDCGRDEEGNLRASSDANGNVRCPSTYASDRRRCAGAVSCPFVDQSEKGDHNISCQQSRSESIEAKIMNKR
jgi:hypothetical protein